MRDHPWSSTVTGADRHFGALLAATEAERDRYQLLLNVNNAVVTCLGLRSPCAPPLILSARSFREKIFPYW